MDSEVKKTDAPFGFTAKMSEAGNSNSNGHMAVSPVKKTDAIAINQGSGSGSFRTAVPPPLAFGASPNSIFMCFPVSPIFVFLAP